MSLFRGIVSDVGRREKIRKAKARKRKIKRRTEPWKKKYKREIRPGVTEYPVYPKKTILPSKRSKRRQ